MSGLGAGSRTIPEALAKWATMTPDAAAVLSPTSGPLTYRDLESVVDDLAARVRAAGVGRGDGIALLLPEGPELAVAMLAAMSTGIAVPLPWPHGQGEHAELLRGGRIGAVVALVDFVDSVRETVDDAVPVLPVGAADWEAASRDRCAGAGRDASSLPVPDDVALILRSSGTTGRAKLVPRTHGAVVAFCRDVIEARAITANERCLSLARGWYSQGINALMVAVASGGSVIVVADRDLAALPGWLKAYRPTFMSTTPAVLRSLVAARPAVHEAIRGAALRSIHASAGPLSAAEVEHLESTLATPILNGYGMSEASGIAGERFPRSERVPGSVGSPWCPLRLVDAAGEDVAPGEVGEIVVRGDRVFSGYLDDPEANAAAFLPGGWFRTRDLGSLDDAGRLFLTGRQTEVINRGGEKIVPDDVDAILVGHPAVAEAAVFAIPHARLGEDVVAAVVVKPGANPTAREIRRWLHDQIGLTRTPRRIWFVPSLPRTDTGKVRRGELARQWEAQR